ncbi:MAG: hypothetical protein KC417_02060, partial [Myxococcales bacterium]|nr:hypothetical protein [Myxococcales bacterium]
MKKLPRIRSAFALFLFAASAPAAAHAQSGDDARRSQVIVSGTDIKITVGDVEDAIAQQSPFMRVRYRDPAKLAELVESMVNASLFAREATARGYDKDPDVVRNTKQTAVQTMIRKTIDDALTPESIPEPEVKAYYDAHSNEFHRPGLVRVSHILVPTKARAMEILAEAK